MRYTNITLPVTLSRTGLTLHITAGKYAQTSINLQEYFGWNEEQAQHALTLLAQKNIPLALAEPQDEEDKSDPASTTIHINHLVENGWVQYPEEQA